MSIIERAAGRLNRDKDKDQRDDKGQPASGPSADAAVKSSEPVDRIVEAMQRGRELAMTSDQPTSQPISRPVPQQPAVPATTTAAAVPVLEAIPVAPNAITAAT